MRFDPIEFVKANLGASIAAGIVFVVASIYSPKDWGIIPLALAAGAFLAYKAIFRKR